MLVEKNVSLQSANSFGIAARAKRLVRVRSQDNVREAATRFDLARKPFFVLGGGSNTVLTSDVKPIVLKVEIPGMALVRETPSSWIVQAGAAWSGMNWWRGRSSRAGPGWKIWP